jgi:hypothetical protein
MNTLNEKLMVTNIGKEVNDWLSDYVFEREFDRKFDHYFDVKKKEGIVESNWEVTSVSDLYSRSDYPSALVLTYDEHWGDEEIRVDIEGNRWIDLWRAAEKAIILSGDLHHVYIEEFRGVPASDEISLSTGS